MNILYGHQIFTRQTFGGVSRYFHEISKRIPMLTGDSAEVFAPLHVNAYLTQNPRLLRPSVQLNKFRGGAAILGSFNACLGLFGTSRNKHVDIYHPSYYPQVDYRPKNSGLIVTVFDMIHELEPASFSRFDPTAKLKRRAVASADHVICISGNTQRDLVDITGVKIEKTSIIHLGHSLGPPAHRDMTRPLLDRPFILHVGQRGGYKNFPLLIEAFASSRELTRTHTLVCFGGGGFTGHELAMARAFGLSHNNLRHMDGNDAQLSRLYASADVFVYPSRYEGFGIPLLEAMSRGCPVACANTSSLPEVAGPAAEYFDPNDPTDLRRAMETVITAPGRAAQLSDFSHVRSSQFSWDKCATATHAQYLRISGNLP
ncbi:MAG: glycosyltransferase family 1 protein [Gammaproteobacteria bacterium]|nr:MAG: glycosyltransferase family 1 protein [Gammaproteobacteria bacterium]